MKYIFGPVPSRRLGLSLGVDLLPPKTCNMNCIYCELGPGKGTVCDIREYTPLSDIQAEIRHVCLEEPRDFDCLTFTASGEPTLYSRLGELILFARDVCGGRPIVVLTNAGLVHRKDVRDALAQADFVLPSLDAVTGAVFRRINRPDPCIKLNDVIKGLVLLRQKMKGRMWLEILLVQGINDSDQEIMALKKALAVIGPDRVQLNTVVRPPAEAFAKPVARRRMEEIKDMLGENAEIIVDYSRKLREGAPLMLESEILDMLRRRPLSIQDMKKLFGGYRGIDELLARLMDNGVIARKRMGNQDFYCMFHDSPIDMAAAS